jgi:hypothetical protein
MGLKGPIFVGYYPGLFWGFMKKFTYGFLNMGFTLAGSLVVYLTLSGTIQKVAGIATILAFAGTMFLHMKEPESE